jgi:threonine dehydrogenase-like Zn-dependent dehydrogenase
MAANATSLAAVAVKPRHTELQEFSLPDIPPDAGILRVSATGICGSDWPMYLSEWPGPRILGHEMVGTIERLGAAARDRWGVAEGDYVALEEYLPCGHCDYCRSGEYRACTGTDRRVAGSIRYGSTPLSVKPSLWGGYSQYLYLHPRSIFHRVPKDMPPHIAAMALPIGNGFQWVRFDAGAGPGQTIVIQGPGQQGLGCVIAAKVSGVDTIIVSGLARDEHRFAAARALGATHTVAVDTDNLEAKVRDITGGRMADIVIEATAAGPEIVNTSMALLRRGGKLMLAGRKGGPVPNFEVDRFLAFRLTLHSLRGHSYQAVELALRTMASGAFPLDRMSSHVVGLSDVDAALRMVGGESKERSIHITVDPWKT